MLLQGITVWQALAAPSPRRSRFLVASALAWPLAGNLLAGSYMSAGPWFAARSDPFGSPFVGLSDVIARLGGRTMWAQDYLYSAYEGRNSWEVAAGISAMPSMHLVMATIIACFLWGRGLVGRALGLAFVVGIFVGSVVLGWHYAVDSYAGILAGMLIWLVAGQLVKTSRRRVGVETEG
jgi:membrane-associated phospholipid phosphatase